MMENVLSTTEGAVLGLVAFGERSGYELSRLSAHSIEHLWTPSQSQIYKTLPRLVGRGLVRARRVEQHDRPDKSLYKITPAGRRALRAWLDDVEEEPASGRVVFALKLFFCDFASPGTDRAHLQAYDGYLRRRLASYEALRVGPSHFDSPYPGLVLRHGIRRTRATLRWVAEALAALEAKARV